jgi:hypothetical protein
VEYFLLFEPALVGFLNLRVVVSAVDGIIYSYLLGSVENLLMILGFLHSSYFLGIFTILATDDIVYPAFLGMNVAIMFLDLPIPNLSKVLLFILLAIDDVVILIDWIFVLLLPIFLGMSKALRSVGGW